MRWRDHLFHTLANPHTFFLNLDQLPKFYLLCFQCHEISLRGPLMLSFFFLLMWLPLGHLCLSSFIAIHSRNSSGRISSLWTVTALIYSWSGIYSTTPFTFGSSFIQTLSLVLSFFPVVLFWLVNSLFQWSISVKCHLGFSLGVKESTSFAVCVWTD